jgi:Cys-tRNA synthase (O-phospho-L-seryl-tRNA:Cys-tRNA synthase)
LFCPKCRDEFREGFAVCPDCDVSLVNQLPEQKQPPAEEFVTVATFENLIAASVARGALEAAGIHAFVPEDTRMFGFNQAVLHQPWAELKVKASDLDRAVDALKEAGHR